MNPGLRSGRTIGAKMVVVANSYTLSQLAPHLERRVKGEISLSKSRRFRHESDKRELEQAIKMLRDGDKAKAIELEKMARQYSAYWDKGVRGRKRVYDVSGEILDMDRFLDGEAECEIYKKRDKGDKLVRIYVCLSTTGGVSSTAITRRGASIYCLVRALEKMGKSVEIWGMMNHYSRYDYNIGENNMGVDAIQIKGGRDYLSAARLAYILCHKSVFWCLGLRLMEKWNYEARKITGVEGGSYLCEPSDDKWLKDHAIGDRKALYFPTCRNSTYQSDEQAINYVNAVAIGAGIDITRGRGK